jgi:trehalose 6-phosphate phosphatase
MEDSIAIAMSLDAAPCQAGDAPPPAMDFARDALLLDVDGTILEIAPAPDLVHVPDRLVDLLSRLNERTRGALALISGRTLHDLDALFAPLRLAAVGCHGAEARLHTGEGTAVQARALDARLRERLAGLNALGAGIITEDKRFAVALHYRLAPELGQPLLEAARAAVAELGSPNIELMHGKHVIEVKHVGVTKGTAFRALMREPPFAGRRAVFLGDDTTDQAVFDELPAFGGYGISVGRSMKGANYCFRRPSDVVAWLSSVAGA